MDRGLYHLETNVLESTSYLLPLASKTSFSESWIDEWYAKASPAPILTFLSCCVILAWSNVRLWDWNFVMQNNPWITNFLLLVISSHKSKVCVREDSKCFLSMGLPYDLFSLSWERCLGSRYSPVPRTRRRRRTRSGRAWRRSSCRKSNAGTCTSGGTTTGRGPAAAARGTGTGKCWSPTRASPAAPPARLSPLRCGRLDRTALIIVNRLTMS